MCNIKLYKYCSLEIGGFNLKLSARLAVMQANYRENSDRIASTVP
jgi:hypothetical protein